MRLSDTIVTAYVGKTSTIKKTQREMWNAILNIQITELNCGFHEERFGIMRAAASFLPRSTTFGELALLRNPNEHFGISITEAED